MIASVTLHLHFAGGLLLGLGRDGRIFVRTGLAPCSFVYRRYRKVAPLARRAEYSGVHVGQCAQGAVAVTSHRSSPFRARPHTFSTSLVDLLVMRSWVEALVDDLNVGVLKLWLVAYMLIFNLVRGLGRTIFYLVLSIYYFFSQHVSCFPTGFENLDQAHTAFVGCVLRHVELEKEHEQLRGLSMLAQESKCHSCRRERGVHAMRSTCKVQPLDSADQNPDG